MKTRILFFLAMFFSLVSCGVEARIDEIVGAFEEGAVIEESIEVKLQINESYTYNTTVSIDEGDVEILTDAQHATTSEIIQDADTNFFAIYKYMPEEGFEGTDTVELELTTVKDDNTEIFDVKIIKITFIISENENVIISSEENLSL